MVDLHDRVVLVSGANAGMMRQERSFLDMTTEAWHGLLAVLVPDEHRVGLTFDEIVADDVAAATRVVERAGLSVTEGCLADREGYIASHPRGKHGRVVRDLEGDFRLDGDELRRRFAFYIDAFGLPAEAQQDGAR